MRRRRIWGRGAEEADKKMESIWRKDDDLKVDENEEVVVEEEERKWINR